MCSVLTRRQHEEIARKCPQCVSPTEKPEDRASIPEDTKDIGRFCQSKKLRRSSAKRRMVKCLEERASGLKCLREGESLTHKWPSVWRFSTTSSPPIICLKTGGLVWSWNLQKKVIFLIVQGHNDLESRTQSFQYVRTHDCCPAQNVGEE